MAYRTAMQDTVDLLFKYEEVRDNGKYANGASAMDKVSSEFFEFSLDVDAAMRDVDEVLASLLAEALIDCD